MLDVDVKESFLITLMYAWFMLRFLVRTSEDVNRDDVETMVFNLV